MWCGCSSDSQEVAVIGNTSYYPPLLSGNTEALRIHQSPCEWQGYCLISWNLGSYHTLSVWTLMFMNVHRHPWGETLRIPGDTTVAVIQPTGND